ncbi:Hpt domain-containing protein [Catenovulum sp. SM1970]|uniref:Hpt domain-containing protein n=1 Tax=Marinifaba aquimaris TaxID=2741323 RepID=UPI0015725E05|nr:Hpt domain-containing protein [Marinifaba aquimaris]NTS78877.1 Hpt domain-containing protein [Marinifaba aquimaris]
MASNLLATFWEMFEDDTAAAKEVATVFCEYIPEVLTDIHNAAQGDDKQNLVDLLHRLKGSIGYLGFTELSAKIIQQEKHAIEHGELNDDGTMPEIQTELNAIMQEMYRTGLVI